MSYPVTPQYIGRGPLDLTVKVQPPASTCSKTLCKIVFPILIGVAVILLILLIVRLLNKNKHPDPTPSPATTLQFTRATAPVRPFVRNVPPFSPNGAQAAVQQRQAQAAPVNQPPQGYQGNGGASQYSAYQSGGQSGPQQQVAKMLDQRYVQLDQASYQDNKMAAYQNYSEAVGNAGQVLQWDEAAFNKEVLQGKQPALVGFFMDGCGPCKATKPAFIEAAKYAKIPVVMIERGSAGSLLQKYGIRGFPTIALFRGGEKVQEYSGDRSTNSFVEFAK